MKITGAQVFEARGAFVSRDLYVDGGMLTDRDCGGEVLDAGGCYAIPGLTDIHFHGAVGHDFSDGDADGRQAIAEYELSRGVTQICPAGMTLLPEALEKMCTVAAEHRRAEKPGASLCGINLEGPFLSMAKKGAQNGDWLQKPNMELLRELEEVSGGLVKLVSVAPEVEGAMDFIRAASNEVRVSIAHTTADYDTAMAAFAAGASHVTHLFNAMPPFTHRAPGVVGAAFDTPDCRVELICDGIHIHPSVVRSVFKLFGADRVVLVSDTMRAAGMADGDYSLGGPAGGQEGQVRHPGRWHPGRLGDRPDGLHAHGGVLRHPHGRRGAGGGGEPGPGHRHLQPVRQPGERQMGQCGAAQQGPVHPKCDFQGRNCEIAAEQH